jgi:hypothetical protein
MKKNRTAMTAKGKKDSSVHWWGSAATGAAKAFEISMVLLLQ